MKPKIGHISIKYNGLISDVLTSFLNIGYEPTITLNHGELDTLTARIDNTFCTFSQVIEVGRKMKETPQMNDEYFKLSNDLTVKMDEAIINRNNLSNYHEQLIPLFKELTQSCSALNGTFSNYKSRIDWMMGDDDSVILIQYTERLKYTTRVNILH